MVDLGNFRAGGAPPDAWQSWVVVGPGAVLRADYLAMNVAYPAPTTIWLQGSEYGRMEGVVGNWWEDETALVVRMSTS